jgi:UDP-glucose 4-epimerase
MRILVTGGAGFIGSHLAESLLDRGDEVWALDDLSTGRLENLHSFAHHPRFHFQQGSVLDAVTVQRLVMACDRVFHLAAAVGVKFVIENRLRSLRTNVFGTEAVLEACSRHRCRVILFSSSEVYGKGTAIPFAEDGDRLLGPTHKPRWSYAYSKAVDECLALAHWDQERLPVTIVRCFNTCGPRQTGAYGMVIPSMVQRALRGEPILIHGDGQQSRCFSAVSDVVRGTLLLADCEAAAGEIFNIGSDEEVTIAELAERVRAMCGSSSPIENVSYERIYGRSFEDMRRRVPDLAKIRRFVGYRPTVTLDELIATVLREMRNTLRVPIPLETGL